MLRAVSHLRIAGLFLLGALATACAAEPAVGTTDLPTEQIGRVSSAIIDGTDSEDNQDFVLQLGLETDGAVTPQCSSTLIAKNLLLTARHCVADLDEKTATMGPNYEPSRFTVYVGKDGPQQIENGAEPAARGKRVITQGTSSMFPDIALIVLDTELDAPVATIRLDDGPQKSELVNVVGFGMNEKNVNVQVRMQKDDVKVLALAPEVTQFHTLHAGEFAFGEAACYGDSGGPALSATSNAIVGVASRVNSGVAGTEAKPNAMCLGAEDVFTSMKPFRALVDSAFAAAGAKPKIEAPLAVVATTTKGNTDTQSTAYTNSAVISAADATSGGCSTTGSPSSRTGGFTAGLGLALVAVSRRRRTAS